MMSQHDTSNRTAVIGATLPVPVATVCPGADEAVHEHRLERLIARLPERMRSTICRLRHPSARWVRIPAGSFLVLGGFLFILPLFGMWMTPLGLILLAEDVRPLRRMRNRALDWLERRKPHWFDGA
jgi:hypothetical protein